jgi:hypothetical protein
MFRVFSLMRPLSLNARLTVEKLLPVALAMSKIVTGIAEKVNPEVILRPI